MAEIEISHVNVKTFNQLIKSLVNDEDSAVIHIRGIESTSPAQQRKLLNNISNIKAQLIFSFTETPESFNKNTIKLDQDLWNMLRNDFIYLPPLRAIGAELDEYIHTFIVQYNEKYGKQVVGFRPKVLQVLHAHPWNRNFSELREVIRHLVMNSEGEYIEEEALSLISEKGSVNQQGIVAGGKVIDMNQPLELIERDIIRIILEQENMNQSKTAKRLGINRATLWRKLKDKE